jgi:hypothetical protein
MKNHVCNIIPTRLLKKIMEEEEDKALKGHLLNSIRHSEQLRAQRNIIGSLLAMFPTAGSGKQRYIFDAHNDTDVSTSRLVIKEDDSYGGDQVAKEVYDGFGIFDVNESNNHIFKQEIVILLYQFSNKIPIILYSISKIR